MIRVKRGFAYAALLGFVVVCAALLFFTLSPSDVPPDDWTQEQYEEYFVELGERRGAEYAFSVLAQLPFKPGLHEIGHKLGYMLYDQEGGEGLEKCTHDIRSACAHAVVIQEFLHEGAKALGRLSGFCARDPHGSVPRGDCFHGIGHGILAYLSYEYEEAITLCRGIYQFLPGEEAEEAYIQCVGGATMELTQGIHDPVTRLQAAKRYTPETDILMPCNASFMTEEPARRACYSYLHPRLFGATEEELVTRYAPSTERDQRAFAYCATIPSEDVEGRRSCHIGIGAVFAHYTSAVPSLEELRTVQARCELSSEPGHRDCVESAASIFLLNRSGEVAARFCDLSSSEDVVRSCRFQAAATAQFSLKGSARIKACSAFSGEFYEACMAE